MFIKNILTSLRNLRRNKRYSILNLAGLAAGFAGAMLIGLFVADEWRFDSQHSNADRIFRVIEENTSAEGKTTQTASTSLLIAERSKQEVAEIADDHRREKILTASAGVAIFIACLGLFGLATFAAERRRKEIGIRKVLGASISGIMGLLAKDFLTLVVATIVIATPVAYFLMQKWLSDFAYRIEMQWWVFVGAGIVAIMVAVLTVSFQSMKAALINPVKSLRSE